VVVAKSSSAKHFLWKPDWKSGLLTLLLLPVGLVLGAWQLERAEEKRKLLAKFEARQAAAPIPLDSVDTSSDLSHLKVRLTGLYDNTRLWYLDNRVYKGKAGYEIIGAFWVTGNEQVVLVNRGWVAGDPARRSLPAVDTPAGEIEIAAEIYVPPGEPFTLGEELTQEGWPKLVQNLDVKGIGRIADTVVFPFQLRLEAHSPGSLQPNWMVVNVLPEKHTAYAVQWFAMGAVLLVLFIVRSVRHK
jgi:cytochrome oxidase assembly protein ShyY1